MRGCEPLHQGSSLGLQRVSLSPEDLVEEVIVYLRLQPVSPTWGCLEKWQGQVIGILSYGVGSLSLQSASS